MFNKVIFLENDKIQLINNVTYRKADELDHMEMIIAITKLRTAEELFGDINKLLDMIK